MNVGVDASHTIPTWAPPSPRPSAARGCSSITRAASRSPRIIEQGRYNSPRPFVVEGRVVGASSGVRSTVWRLPRPSARVPARTQRGTEKVGLRERVVHAAARAGSGGTHDTIASRTSGLLSSWNNSSGLRSFDLSRLLGMASRVSSRVMPGEQAERPAGHLGHSCAPSASAMRVSSSNSLQSPGRGRPGEGRR